MGAETKTVNTKGAEVQGDGPRIEVKAKIAIVNSLAEILSLTRSDREETRRRQLDWPGGSADPEKPEESRYPVKILYREGEEELPGVQLHNLRLLDVITKTEDDMTKITNLFAGTATFPEEVEGEGGVIDLSHEHSAAGWVHHGLYPGLSDRSAPERYIPGKYRRTIAANAAVIEELAELAQYAVPLGQPEEPGQPMEWQAEEPAELAA